SEVAAKAVAISVPGPRSFVVTLPAVVATGVVITAPAAPTISCVLPMPLNESPTAFGLTVIVVFRTPVQPKLSVTVIVIGRFSTVSVGVPDTTPVVGAIERPVGNPGTEVTLHVKLVPVLPVWVKVVPAYVVLKRPSGIAV